jgi:hypothetical protein
MMIQHDYTLSEPQYMIRITRSFPRCTRFVFPFDGVGLHILQERPSVTIIASICYYRLLLKGSKMNYSHMYCYDRRFSFFAYFLHMTKGRLTLELTREAKCI